MTGGPARLELPPTSAAAGVARAFVRERWSDLEAEETLDDVALCVSEFVTNALDHAIPPFELRISRQPGWLRVEVDDASVLPPVLHPLTPSAQRGRGVYLVASVASRWGVDVNAAGKTVWAEFASRSY